ncbi:putative serine/threonine-protein kinase ifkB [Diplonema papillatum]|nr:putative serine/threonine-protein kinase ifkB [Diplonema papillatum]
MEYCDERTLRECIESRVFTSSPEGFRLGLAVLRQLLESVDYIHRQGVVHRDLKPENVFFDSGAHPIADTGSSVGIKVGDFGLASFEREEYAGSPATRFSRPASASECWTLDEPSSQKERLSATCRQPERASCRPSPSDTVVVAAGESQRPPLCSKQAATPVSSTCSCRERTGSLHCKHVHRPPPLQNVEPSGSSAWAVVKDGGRLVPMPATPLKRSRGVGTPLYCAPEQETTTEYSCLVDEYSVGIIAFEMFAGFREIERVRGIRELRRTGRVPDAWLGRKYPALVAIVESLAALSSTERSSASEVLMRWFDSTLTPFHAMSSRVSLDLIQLLYPSSPSASNRAVLPNGSASALSSALTDQQVGARPLTVVLENWFVHFASHLAQQKQAVGLQAAVAASDAISHRLCLDERWSDAVREIAVVLRYLVYNNADNAGVRETIFHLLERWHVLEPLQREWVMYWYNRFLAFARERTASDEGEIVNCVWSG